ncbi:hypothetical protein GUJ93_ZPchr0004g38118 [Zizania palustris]|uniref:Uncharacterized protein n=1 Tax=Zizania palustris TaxID=103762 RepID=A0A8J5SJX4_ZIZPA|nr:hypothetical protein GUJ93_ZPchr0004g38118 [Zizania palustris]
MQQRLIVKGSILGFLRDLKSIGMITRTVVLRHLLSMSVGLRAKYICRFLPPPCYFLLKSRYLGSRILRKVFISSRGDLGVLGTGVIGLKHRGSGSGASGVRHLVTPSGVWSHVEEHGPHGSRCDE